MSLSSLINPSLFRGRFDTTTKFGLALLVALLTMPIGDSAEARGRGGSFGGFGGRSPGIGSFGGARSFSAPKSFNAPRAPTMRTPRVMTAPKHFSKPSLRGGGNSRMHEAVTSKKVGKPTKETSKGIAAPAALKSDKGTTPSTGSAASKLAPPSPIKIPGAATSKSALAAATKPMSNDWPKPPPVGPGHCVANCPVNPTLPSGGSSGGSLRPGLLAAYAAVMGPIVALTDFLVSDAAAQQDPPPPPAIVQKAPKDQHSLKDYLDSIEQAQRDLLKPKEDKKVSGGVVPPAPALRPADVYERQPEPQHGGWLTPQQDNNPPSWLKHPIQRGKLELRKIAEGLKKQIAGLGAP